MTTEIKRSSLMYYLLISLFYLYLQLHDQNLVSAGRQLTEVVRDTRTTSRSSSMSISHLGLVPCISPIW